MTPEDGDWVAAHVLTKRIIDSCGGLGLIRVCPCQYGLCGHCAAGQHHHCSHRNGAPVPATGEGYVLSRGGYVLAAFHLAGGRRQCRWVCPCCGVRTRPVAQVLPAPVPAPVHSRPVLVIERPTLF